MPPVSLRRRVPPGPGRRLLAERINQLKERYGLSDQDLNLDLGPLGALLPRDL
jgi:hypothetical protein